MSNLSKKELDQLEKDVLYDIVNGIGIDNIGFELMASDEEIQRHKEEAEIIYI